MNCHHEEGFSPTRDLLFACFDTAAGESRFLAPLGMTIWVTTTLAVGRLQLLNQTATNRVK